LIEFYWTQKNENRAFQELPTGIKTNENRLKLNRQNGRQSTSVCISVALEGDWLKLAVILLGPFSAFDSKNSSSSLIKTQRDEGGVELSS
jgi:hypothetical protein